MPDCTRAHYAKTFCTMHYFRYRKHGNPYEKRRPQCESCRAATQIVNRKYPTEYERMADLYLLFSTGTDFRLTTVDEKGRDYDLEDQLRREA